MKAALTLLNQILVGGLLLPSLSHSAPTSDAPFDFTEEFSGGATTVFDSSSKAFGFPAANLNEERRASFFVGHSFFNENWVVAPASTAGRDGLGPLFNARSCSTCHMRDGRGAPPEAGTPMVAMLLRISVPGAGLHQGPVPEPTYGGQIQGQSIPGVPAEADAYVNYVEVPGQFSDGEKYSLRQPSYTITNLGYGPLTKNLMVSPRAPSAMIGMGLLEAVPAKTLRALADQQRSAGQGIAGRINAVWDTIEGKKAPGRFGWKAEQPTLLQQIATAFVEDIGITSSLKTHENHSSRQLICATQLSGGHPEVSDKILKDVVIYTQTLAVPARRNWTDPVVRRGETLFVQLNCASCHVPEMRTGNHEGISELSNQTIRPYTDLLLHDMGEGLADHRPVFEASGRDWRTAPLWGIGLVEKVNGHTCFLHDGRARNFSEAILWHGGEANAARESYRHLSKKDRDAVIAFLQSL